MSETKKFPLFSVEIVRGKDVITVEVPEHQVRVLQVIHDTADTKKVKVVGPAGGTGDDQDTIELVADRDAEYDRLLRTYERVNAPNPVKFAFPGGPPELDKYGFGEASGPVEQRAGSQVKKGGKVVAKAAPSKK